VSGIVVDTSAWIEFFAGRESELLAESLASGAAIVPPVVVAELVTGATTRDQREAIGELLQDVPVHDTPLEHWIAVGDLRRSLRRNGLTITTPDAHVAQCAIERDAILLTYDDVFSRIAAHTSLRVRR
jgi:predicted nucleic acid-binding protein